MTEKEFHRRFSWLYPHLEYAGRKLRLYQRNRGYGIRSKKDGSKVTDVDEEMSAFWLDLLHRYFPGEAVVSEEDSDSHRYPPDSDLVWFVDPLDGTSKFIDGSPNYFILISICTGGKASFGVLYQPERNIVLYGNAMTKARLYSSRDEYRDIHTPLSWKHRKPLVVKGAPPALRNRIEEITHLSVKRTSVASHNIISPLSAVNTGFISFRKTAYWDLGAPAAIMESAGYKTGAITYGEQTRFNNGLVYCDRFYSLPADTPDEVISYITTVTA
ncbi:inositol monophosphatase family protein [Balneolales bacterium ANBcel1]|nr:inositol monophosphatase family protein [Balneolales bacterium ANBcel1]